MTLPETVKSIEEGLRSVPVGADVSLIVRHAEREAIPEGEFGQDVPLTPAGIESAEQLGAVLAGWRGETVRCSPLPRCVQTAAALARRAGWSPKIVGNAILGEPGPFVTGDEAGQYFLKHGILEIVRQQLHEDAPPPGMRPTAEGINLLLRLTASELGHDGCMRVFVTHDAILAVFMARLFGLRHDEVPWPQYLDGLILWRSDGGLKCSWRGLEETTYPFGG